jgi:hypothetical protein
MRSLKDSVFRESFSEHHALTIPLDRGSCVTADARDKLGQRKRKHLRHIENRPGPDCGNTRIGTSKSLFERAECAQMSAPGGISVLCLIARTNALIATDDVRPVNPQIRFSRFWADGISTSLTSARRRGPTRTKSM